MSKSADTIKKKTALLHEQHKKKVEALKSQGRPPLYKSSKAYAYKIAVYLRDCDNTMIDSEKGKTEPYTITGLQVATGLYSGVYDRYRKGQHDGTVIDNTLQTDDGRFIEDVTKIYDTEKAFIYDCEQDDTLRKYMAVLYDDTDINQMYFSTIDQKARLLIEKQAEQRLYIRGSVADIFTMKSRYKWQEENTTVHKLEVSTSEEARKALEDLRLLSE